MKNKVLSGFSAGYAIAIVVLVGIFITLVGLSQAKKAEQEIDYKPYMELADDGVAIHAHYIEGNDDNGGIADHVKGNIETAKVVIIEYADYQCPGCSTTNPRLNKLVEEYNGELAIIYRNFLLSYHQNGTAAASAAEAAAIQGYWKEYADKLFTNQSSWEYASGSERTELFEGYFTDVTNGEGDLEKFRSDISSNEVKKKIDFDMGLGKKIDVPGTPALYLKGERIDFSDAGTEEKFLNLMRSIVNRELGRDTNTESEEPQAQPEQ